MNRITTHLQGNVVAYVALFFALSAGAYAAGLAPSSVKSKHISDEQVKHQDLAADAVTGANVLNSTLGGPDLGSNSVGGAQILESSLGEVPRATIAGHGGYGRQTNAASSCTPPDITLQTCASVGLTPTAASRALVIGRFRAEIDGGELNCNLGSSAFGALPGSHVEVDEDGEYVTLVGITEPLNAGNHSFGIDCYESDDSVSVADATVTAVAISPF